MATPTDSAGYPPYNIELTGEDKYRISLAVAGFSTAELVAGLRRPSFWRRLGRQ